MAGRFDDLTEKLDRFEPGGYGDDVARGLIEGVIALAESLEQIRWDTERVHNLSGKIDALSEKLDGFVWVLSSVLERDELDPAE